MLSIEFSIDLVQDCIEEESHILSLRRSTRFLEKASVLSILDADWRRGSIWPWHGRVLTSLSIRKRVRVRERERERERERKKERECVMAKNSLKKKSSPIEI